MALDELWSFVQRNSPKKWLWVTLFRRTRQVVSHVVGPRSEKSCKKLWKFILEAYKRCLSFSDLWGPMSLFLQKTHTSVGKESRETHHVERWKNTLRQRLARFVRKTLSFSKTTKFHEIALKLFIWNYNQYAISRLEATT